MLIKSSGKVLLYLLLLRPTVMDPHAKISTSQTVAISERVLSVKQIPVSLAQPFGELFEASRDNQKGAWLNKARQ